MSSFDFDIGFLESALLDERAAVLDFLQILPLDDLYAEDQFADSDSGRGRRDVSDVRYAPFRLLAPVAEDTDVDYEDIIYLNRFAGPSVDEFRRVFAKLQKIYENRPSYIERLIQLDMVLGAEIAVALRHRNTSLICTDLLRARYEVFSQLVRLESEGAASYVKGREMQLRRILRGLRLPLERAAIALSESSLQLPDVNVSLYEQAFEDVLDGKVGPDLIVNASGDGESEGVDVSVAHRGIYMGEQVLRTSFNSFLSLYSPAFGEIVIDLAIADALVILSANWYLGYAEVRVDEKVDENKLAQYEVAKFHVANSASIWKLFLAIVPKYDFGNPVVTAAHYDYRDLGLLQLARRRAVELARPDVNDGDEAEVLAESLFCALAVVEVVDKLPASSDLVALLAVLSPVSVLSRLRKFERALLEMMFADSSAVPEGFRSFDSFSDSENFATYSDYVQQFNTYIDNFSSIEADRFGRVLILGSGLSIENLVQPIRRLHIFTFLTTTPGLIAKGTENHNRGKEYCLGRTPFLPVPGRLAMVQLFDESWMMVSNVNGELWATVLAKDVVSANPALSVLADPTDHFFSSRRSSGWLIGSAQVNGPLLRDNVLKKLRNNWDSLDLKKCWYVAHLSGDVNAMRGADLKRAISYILETSLNGIAEHAKQRLYKPSEWQRFAFSFVPFYREIFFSVNDSRYRPSVGSIVFDAISILSVLVTAGVRLSAFGLQQLSEINQVLVQNRLRGLVGGALWRSVFAALPRLAGERSLRLSGSLLLDLYDLLEPVPVRSLVTRILATSIRPAQTGARVSQVFGLGSENVVGEVNSRWQDTSVAVADLVREQRGGRFEGLLTRPFTDSAHFIEVNGAPFRVTWDGYAQSWRILPHGATPVLSYTYPVRRNAAGQWVTHLDVPGRGGMPWPWDRIPEQNLLGLDVQQAGVLRDLLREARARVLSYLRRSLSQLNSPAGRPDVDSVLTLWFGEAGDTVRARYGARLLELTEQLREFRPARDVQYRIGYDLVQPENILAVSRESGRGLQVICYVDATADLNRALQYPRERFVELLTYELLKEFSANGVLELAEVSPPVYVSGGLNVATLVRAGASRFHNHAAMALSVMLTSYRTTSPLVFSEFLSTFVQWTADSSQPLIWTFSPSSARRQGLQLPTSVVGQLYRGDIGGLSGHGALFGHRTVPLPAGLNCQAVRVDRRFRSSQPQTLDTAAYIEPRALFREVIDVWAGSNINSRAPTGVRMGEWGEGSRRLTDNVHVVSVANGDQGTIGLRLDLLSIQEHMPLIFTSGELSGCTTALGIRDNALYVFHAGQSGSDPAWLTRHDGVQSLYQAHLSLQGATVDSPPQSNDDLVDIMATYDSAAIIYFGKDLPEGMGSAHIRRQSSSVAVFDYNAAVMPAGALGRFGQALVLVSKASGQTSVHLLAEDYVVMPDSRLRVLGRVHKRLVD